MVLDDIASYIDANSTALTLGTNFFKGGIPATTAGTVLGLYESGGLPPVWAFGGSNPVYERVRVQIISRSTKYSTARSRAETVYALLDRIANSTSISSSGPRYVMIAAVQSPFYIGPDDQNRPQISCNFDVWKEMS